MTIDKDQRIVELEQELASKTAYANELSSKLHIETNKHHAVIEQRRKLEEAVEKLKREVKQAEANWSRAELTKYFAMEASRTVAAVLGHADYVIAKVQGLLEQRTWNTTAVRKAMRTHLEEYEEIRVEASRRSGREVAERIASDILIDLLKNGYTEELRSRLETMAAEQSLDFIHADRAHEARTIAQNQRALRERAAERRRETPKEKA